MRRALVGLAGAVALGAGPVGVFLMLRRMSLTGDAMAHAILPGAAVGYLRRRPVAAAMTIGGLVAGFAVALLAGVVARSTVLKEDASLAAFYLISLALGVTLVSLRGSNVDLLHVLFGTVLALDDDDAAADRRHRDRDAGRARRCSIARSCWNASIPASCARSAAAGGPAHHRLPRPRRAQPRRRLPCARHAAGGRPDDAARRRRAVLDARHQPCSIAVGDADRHRVRRRGPAAVLPCRAAGRARDHPGRRARPMSRLARCSARRAGCSWPPHAPAAISKPDVAQKDDDCLRTRSSTSLLAAAVPSPRCLPLPAATRPAAAKLPVVASFSILGDFVREVGGDRVDVDDARRPERRRPCLSSRRPPTRSALAGAKLVVVNGLGFEGWIDRLVKASGTKADGRRRAAHAGDASRCDEQGRATGTATTTARSIPHAWQDVANAKIYVANIRDALIAADPAGRARLRGQCRRLSRAARRARRRGRGRRRRGFPPTRRKVITSHDAFGYFAKRLRHRRSSRRRASRPRPRPRPRTSPGSSGRSGARRSRRSSSRTSPIRA